MTSDDVHSMLMRSSARTAGAIQGAMRTYGELAANGDQAARVRRGQIA